MKIAIPLAAMLLATPCFAESPVAASAIANPAPSPRAIKAVDALMALSGGDAMMDAMIPRLVDGIMPLLIRDNAGKESVIRAILRDEFVKIMGALKPDFLAKTRQVYLDRFSAQELEDMAAFMGSPTGRKMTREMPAISNEMMTFGQGVGRAAVAGALPRILEKMRAAQLATPSGT